MALPASTTIAQTPLPAFAVDPRRACADADATLFFPEPGDQRRRAVQAREICRTCIFVADCLAYALPITDLFGVWGATTALERKEMRGRGAVRLKRGAPGEAGGR